MNEEQFIEAINRSMRETEVRLRAMGRKPYYVTREEAEKQVAMLLKAKEDSSQIRNNRGISSSG